MGSTPPPPYSYNPNIDPRGIDPRLQARMYRDQQRAQYRAQREQYRMQRHYWRSMRRRSVVGPLLLISIGIVFLLIKTGRLSTGAFFGWYGHWWPVLLIAVGVGLLIEWAIDRNRSAADGGPVPGVRVGGGVIWLLILLGFVGATTNGARDVNWNGLGSEMGLHNDDHGDWVFGGLHGDKHEFDQQLSQKIPAGATVTIQNSHGDVIVGKGMGAGLEPSDSQMQLTIHKSVYGGSEDDARKKADGLQPVITVSGSAVTVKLSPSDNAATDLTITLPANSPVDITAERGDVTVNGRQGNVAVESQHGDVQLDAIEGNVRAKLDRKSDFTARTISGDVSVEGHAGDVTISGVRGGLKMDGDFFGDQHIEHIGGAVHFHSSRTDFELARLDGAITMDSGDLTADRVAGPVRLRTREKDIELTQVAGDVKVDTTGGSVSVTAAPPMGDVEINNSHGGVKLTVPEGAGFSVSATANNGEINNDFNLSGSGPDDTHSTIEGTLGGGGAKVRLEANKGDIELRKANIAPLSVPPPPAPPRVGEIPGPPKPPRPPKVAANAARAAAAAKAQETQQ